MRLYPCNFLSCTLRPKLLLIINALESIFYLLQVFLQYALCFAILFVIWFRHRQINELQNSLNRFYVLVSAMIMLFATIIPLKISLI